MCTYNLNLPVNVIKYQQISIIVFLIFLIVYSAVQHLKNSLV